MSNIHGLSSIRREEDEEKRRRSGNNRFVGGIDARGGGSGLAVQPNIDDDDDDVGDNTRSRPTRHILDSVRAHATQGSADDGPIQRTITMYRDGFVVDNGPYRRLDDPANASFLMALAHGRTPAELMQDSQGNVTNTEMTVGLIDKRDRDYYQDDHDDEGDGNEDGTASEPQFQSFSGTGSSLGSSTVTPTGGVIEPPSSTASTSSLTTPIIMDPNRPSTSIQIRLINGKRLVAKVNLDSPVSILVQHIRSSGDEGSDSYVLSSGYPPQTLNNLDISIQTAGLSGAQVTQKKVG